MLGSLLSILTFTSVMAQPTEDRVLAPDLLGYVIGYEGYGPTNALRVEVPEGGSAKDWTRMVTTQRFGGRATLTPPESFLTTTAHKFELSCPGAEVGPIKQLSMSGRPAVRIMLKCPLRAKTGKPEIFLIEAISGTFDLLVNQVGFRGTYTTDDIAWATGFLDSLVYCAGGTTLSGCNREPRPQLRQPFHEEPFRPWP